MSKCFQVAQESGCNYILHTEDDFTLNKKINLLDLVKILKSNQSLSQLILQRQPWYDHEKTKDTLIDSYRDLGHEFIEKSHDGIFYIEHSYYWSCNPNVYPVEITKNGWPKQGESEYYFGKNLFSMGFSSAFYDKEDSENYVSHIGNYSLGGGH